MRSLSLAAAVLGLSAALFPAAASAQAVWTLDAAGQKSGALGQRIPVLSVSHEIVSPRDAASGLPTGKRQHKPIVITKEIDKSTPLLMNVLVNNENIPGVLLTKWLPNSKGVLAPVFTVRLTDASIAGVIHGVDIKPAARTGGDPVHGVDVKLGAQRVYPDRMKFEEYEEIAFTYRKIEWTWVDGGITAMDDWEVRQ
jgi:type VI secretion system secreted protein Hcp